jgi:phosphoserine phosphatase
MNVPPVAQTTQGTEPPIEIDSVAFAKATLREAKAVCFDVDSTLISEEGIDVLAAYKGVEQQVADLTNQAMGGSMKFEDALTQRLDLIRPSLKDFEQVHSAHPLTLNPGVQALIELLHEKNKRVYLISGGFRRMVYPVATRLNIPFNRVYANEIYFDKEGNYESFCEKEPTSHDGGKGEVIQYLKDSDSVLTKIVMVGDGSTDMQTKPAADAFIGYGGVVTRENVKEGADWFVTDYDDLIQVLNE